MTKDQVLADFAFLYQRALEEGKWNLAVQVKIMQAKIRGIFIPWLEQDPNSPEAAAKEQILADFAFLYQRIVEAGKWSLAFRVRTMQARIMGFFIHNRPKAPKTSKPEPLTSKTLESKLPEPALPKARLLEPGPLNPEAPEPALPGETSPKAESPESKLLKMFAPSDQILALKAQRQESCPNRKTRRKAEANKQKRRA